MNRSFLFFFLILFTAPADADGFISGNLDDERRRTGIGPVAISLIVSGEVTEKHKGSADEVVPLETITNRETNISSASQTSNHLQLASAEQQQQVSWCQQYNNENFPKEFSQCGSDVSHWTERESRPNATQWISIAISETGPPAFPDDTPSYLAGHDNNGRLPQAPKVTKSRIPGIHTKKTTFNIDQKTASVRTPTGPPSDFISIAPIPNRLTDSAFGPSIATLNPVIHTQTFSRGMQVILPGFRMRMTI